MQGLPIPQNVAELTQLLSDLSRYNLPASDNWVQVGGLLAVAIVGLLALLFGARLARWSLAFGAGAAGAAGAYALATNMALPAIPALAAGGVLSWVAGYWGFRFWQALLLAALLAGAGVAAYYITSLTPHMASYTSAGIESGLNTLPGGSGALAETTWSGEFQSLYAHLAGRVSHLGFSLAAIVVAAAAAGLTFGWLLPWATRSALAATIGSTLLMMAALTLLQRWLPSGASWLAANFLTVGAVLWLASLIYNLLSARRPRRRDAAVEADMAPALG